MPEIPYRLQPDTPLADNLAYINEAFNAIDDENRTKILKNGSTPTLLLGYQKSGFGTAEYGLKIAKPGFDVTTATNDQLAFSSAFNYFKIVLSGTLELVTTGSASEVVELSVNHGLGHTPAFLAFYYDTSDAVDNPDRYRVLPGEVRDDAGPLVYSLDATVTPTTFDVVFFGTYGPATFLIRYYLMQETAN